MYGVIMMDTIWATLLLLGYKKYKYFSKGLWNEGWCVGRWILAVEMSTSGGQRRPRILGAFKLGPVITSPRSECLKPEWGYDSRRQVVHEVIAVVVFQYDLKINKIFSPQEWRTPGMKVSKTIDVQDAAITKLISSSIRSNFKDTYCAKKTLTSLLEGELTKRMKVPYPVIIKEYATSVIRGVDTDRVQLGVREFVV